ncbi:serine/threonine-protein kinase [Biomphalaria pfeifferi]|uniref:Serine/threonine-protein kinase n=1 Tax=Biomphalaria pfeifferi TaxID=112525 RepID=A0AAD8FF00_BIOPF|nr:serine/threonine-protein kinase [Biomphalaria pfeifferi]
MSKCYVDNAQNRKLGRVGLAHGTAVHSRNPSSASSFSGYVGCSSRAASSSSPRVYVDNAQNRSLGRVGLALGSAVHSSSTSTSSSNRSRTYVDNAQNRSLGRVGAEYGTAVHRPDSGRTLSASSNTSRTYVDNSHNRNLGRVGMAYGSSGSKSSNRSSESSSAHKTYVDNALNRSLGRVGQELGSAVHRKDDTSRGSSASNTVSKTYADNALNRSLGRVGLELGSAVHKQGDTSHRSSESSSAHKTYVDNALNRSLGRVGQELGSAVHSKDDTRGSSASGSVPKTYVDNALNRSLGRVGKELGSAVHGKGETSHRSSAYSCGSNVYVDNALNRSLGRVGLEKGTAVHSQVNESRGSRAKEAGTSNVYVDNALNRRLGRVGLEKGTAVHRPGDDSKGNNRSSIYQNSQNTRCYKDNYLNRKLGRVGKPIVRQLGNVVDKKVYADNDYNRRHNRVGMPLGSMPIPKEEQVYKDTPLNQMLGRVGQPWGSFSAKPHGEFLAKLNELDMNDDIPDDFADQYVKDSSCQELFDAFLEMVNRENEIRRRAEDESCDDFDAHQHTSHDVIDRHKDDMIQFKIHQEEEENQDDDQDEDGKDGGADDSGFDRNPTAERYKGSVISVDELKLSSQKIGHGSFGDVYAGEWVEGELVAVKVLRHQQMSNKRVRQFEREISLYCKLDHPNIVRFIGACVTRPYLAIVMEYMELSLHEALHIKEIDFGDHDKQNIAIDISSGLYYLHLKNIAHCDLKPSNILLNNVPGGPTFVPEEPVLAKLTDFGLSMLKAEMESTTSNFQAMRNVGTPRYSAPEVLRGELLDVDEMKRADIYSLALTLIELLLEEVPFEDLDVPQLRQHVGDKGLKPNMENEAILRDDFRKLIHDCLSDNAYDRPSIEMLLEYTRIENIF